MDMSTSEIIQLWYHYEEIAMHFNQLIMQYRLQLMGGVGAIVALTSYLVGSKIEIKQLRHKLRAWLSSGLLIIVTAAAALDIYYYNELLQGAVDALIKLEKSYPKLFMSTMIEARFDGRGTSIIHWVYGAILFIIVIFMVWSWRQVYVETRKQND